jgi:dTMP kinase
MSEGRHQTELFETKERLTDVRERYLDLIGRLGDENIIIVNGNRSVQEISDEIWAKVCHYFV